MWKVLSFSPLMKDLAEDCCKMLNGLGLTPDQALAHKDKQFGIPILKTQVNYLLLLFAEEVDGNVILELKWRGGLSDSDKVYTKTFAQFYWVDND